MMEEEGAGPSSVASPQIPKPTLPAEVGQPPLDPKATVLTQVSEVAEVGIYKTESGVEERMVEETSAADEDHVSRTSAPGSLLESDEDDAGFHGQMSPPDTSPPPPPEEDASLGSSSPRRTVILSPQSLQPLPELRETALRPALKKRTAGGEFGPPPTVTTEFSEEKCVAFDRDYLFSAQGFLKLLEVVFAIVFCGVVGSYCKNDIVDYGIHQRSCFRASYMYDKGYGGLGYELFVGGLSILASLLFFVLNLFSGSYGGQRPWQILELFYTALVALLFLVSWIIHAKYTADHSNTQFFDQYIAGTVFGVCLMFFYSADVVFQVAFFINET